jgi:hypothetical protein
MAAGPGSRQTDEGENFCGWFVKKSPLPRASLIAEEFFLVDERRGHGTLIIVANFERVALANREDF